MRALAALLSSSLLLSPSLALANPESADLAALRAEIASMRAELAALRPAPQPKPSLSPRMLGVSKALLGYRFAAFGSPLFGATISGGSSAVTSATMIDPYVPVDGTMNVTGNLDLSDGSVFTADVIQPSTASGNIVFKNSGGTSIFTILNGGSVQSNLYDIQSARHVYAAGFVYSTPVAQTIADNGGGTAAAYTTLPSGGFVNATCSDADTCEWTITETSATSGQCATIVNIGTNNLVMKHAAGQVLFPSAADQTLGQNDSVRVCYQSNLSAWLGETMINR